MKKLLLLVVVFGLLVGTTAFADHQGTGIGVVSGGGWGSIGGLGNVGLSLKMPSIPIFWGVHFFGGDMSSGFGVGVTGDFYLIDKNLISDKLTNEDGTYNFKLDWYFGLGAFFNTFLGNHSYMNVGARIPIGLSWHIVKELELAFGIVPVIGFSTGTYPLYWAGGGELALRYWF